jgi:diguanylate cyclase (GGDEF)-like protein
LQLLAQSGRPAPGGEPGSPGLAAGLIDALVDLSSRDALTGLANRRSFELALAREVDRVARSGEPALLLVADIDHFKRVNDTHGHAAGDQVLRAVATALLDSVRPMDLVARIGGEEFAIILPNCPEPFGATVAERVRRRVERAPVAAGAGQGSRSTSPSASAAPSRRSGCARRRHCGSSAPTSSSTAPRRKGRNRCSSRPGRSRCQQRGAAGCCSTPPSSSRISNDTDSATRACRRRSRITAVTSGKGGVGKTFVPPTWRRRWRGAGQRVLVLDADLGLANLDVVLNLFPKITLHDVFTGKATLDEAILPAPGGFSVLLAGSGMVEYSRMTPEVREQAARRSSTRWRRATTACCSTPAPASPTWCCSPCRWPTTC